MFNNSDDSESDDHDKDEHDEEKFGFVACGKSALRLQHQVDRVLAPWKLFHWQRRKLFFAKKTKRYSKGRSILISMMMMTVMIMAAEKKKAGNKSR